MINIECVKKERGMLCIKFSDDRVIEASLEDLVLAFKAMTAPDQETFLKKIRVDSERI